MQDVIKNDSLQTLPQFKNSLKGVKPSVNFINDFAAALHGLTMSPSLPASESPLPNKLQLSLLEELTLVPKSLNGQNKNYDIAPAGLLTAPSEPSEDSSRVTLLGSNGLLNMVSLDALVVEEENPVSLMVNGENPSLIDKSYWEILSQDGSEQPALNFTNFGEESELLITGDRKLALVKEDSISNNLFQNSAPSKEDSSPSIFGNLTAISANLEKKTALKSDTQVQDQSQETLKSDDSNMEKQMRILAITEEQPQREKDTQQRNSDILNRPFSNREVNSFSTSPSSQTFQKFIGSSEETFGNQEQEIPVKELPQFILKQINNKIKFNHLTGSSEINLKLKPEELGKMTLQLLAQDGQVSVKILTENVRAREMIEQNLIQLKQTFVNQGIKCTSIDVQVSTDSSFNEFMGQQSNPFNQPGYNRKGKNSFELNKKKDLKIDSYNQGDHLTSPLKSIYEGLELFA